MRHIDVIEPHSAPIKYLKMFNNNTRNFDNLRKYSIIDSTIKKKKKKTKRQFANGTQNEANQLLQAKPAAQRGEHTRSLKHDRQLNEQFTNEQ